MNQRLFQDAGGTTPAIIAGQPVGLIKRLAGSADALQATALSKPTLARWPRTGRRNLANFAQAYSFLTAWPETRTESGLTYTKVATGTEDGTSYVDYMVSGLGTIAGVKAIYDGNQGSIRIPVDLVGGMVHARVQAKVLETSIPISEANGIRLDLTIRSAGNVELSNATSPLTRSTEYTAISVSKNIVEPEAAFVGIKLGFRSAQGEDVGLIRIRLRMLEAAGASGFEAFQNNYGPNDIIEPSVADLWHLYNDGGDSLNVTLPAGTYGLASIDINRAITVTTITSDGTTPINTLRHERQLDVMLRAGAFSSGEEMAIRDYWGRVFA